MLGAHDHDRATDPKLLVECLLPVGARAPDPAGRVVVRVGQGGGGAQDQALQLLPVLRRRAVMAFVLAYCAMVWTASGVRQWSVVLLTVAAPATSQSVVFAVAAAASLLAVRRGRSILLPEDGPAGPLILPSLLIARFS